MGTATREVIAKLSSFGSPVGEMIQNDRLTHAGLPQSGICRGICLDWARRVLQGGKKSFAGSKRPDAQTRRHAQIHSKFELTTAESRRVNAAWIKYVDEYMEARNALQSTVKTPASVKDVLRTHSPSSKVEDSYSIADAGKMCDVLEALCNRLVHRTPVGWSAFAEQLDKIYFENHVGQTPGSRSFSTLRVLDSSEEKLYGTMSEAIGTIVTADRPLPGNVIIVGIGRKLRSEQADHAVAIYREDDATYHFLDANYGVFAYAIRGLFSAWLYLFRGWDGKGPIYGEDDYVLTNKVSYIVLGGTG